MSVLLLPMSGRFVTVRDVSPTEGVRLMVHNALDTLSKSFTATSAGHAPGADNTAMCYPPLVSTHTLNMPILSAIKLERLAPRIAHLLGRVRGSESRGRRAVFVDLTQGCIHVSAVVADEAGVVRQQPDDPLVPVLLDTIETILSVDEA